MGGPDIFLSTCWCAAELKGLVLLDVEIPRAWERVVLLKFGPRASEDATRHVYAEIQARWEHMPPHDQEPDQHCMEQSISWNA